MWFCGCPMEMFLEKYFVARHLIHQLSDRIEHAASPVLRAELEHTKAEAFVDVVSVFRMQMDFLSSAIELNDERWFKYFLVFVNVITFLATLFWDASKHSSWLWNH